MKIESAGGVVFRKRKNVLEILLIQDRFGYWSFPKGKREQGETDEQAALREIQEETQLSGKIMKRLPSTTYHIRSQKDQGIQKVVTYFLVQYLDGIERPQAGEVVNVKWFPIKEAEKILYDKGYANNQPVFLSAKQEINRLFFAK